MSTLQDSDLFIVDRNGNNYQLPNSQMSTVQDTDLFVVERDGVNYKVEAKDVGSGGGVSGYFDTPVEVLTPLNGAGLNDGEPLTPTSSALVSSSPVEVVPNFSTTLYTGNQTPRSISTGIDNTDKSLVWLKSRNSQNTHYLYDTERGPLYALSTPVTTASTERSDSLTSFLSDGFQLGDRAGENGDNNEMVAWNFKAAPGFFDIVTWDGDGQYPRQIPHSLGSSPGCIILKASNDTNPWYVYHKGVGDFYRANLNTPDPFESAGSDIWTPTSTSFSPASFYGGNSLNTSFVAYLFADNPAAGIKCEKYLGDGTGGHFIQTGFKVEFVLIKDATGGSGTNGWYMFDRKRGNGSEDVDAPGLLANESLPEAGKRVELGDNGFTLWEVGGLNMTDRDYVYIALAETPDTSNELALLFQDDTELENIIGPVRMVDENGEVKTPETSAITSVAEGTAVNVFNTTLYTGTGNTAPMTITNDIDCTNKTLIWLKARDSVAAYTIAPWHLLYDTERGVSNRISTNVSDAGVQDDDEGVTQFNSNGFNLKTFSVNSGTNYVAWTFRAAPQFFDIVTWVGDKVSGREIPHGLSSVPGMMLVKKVSQLGAWPVWHKSFPAADNVLVFNESGAIETQPSQFNSTAPTSTHLTVGDSPLTNDDGEDYVAYLFADTPGKIKCGSYTGQATGTLSVDCGFKPGWLMLKASDAGTFWVILDNKRSSNVLYPNLSAEEKNEASFNFSFTDTGFQLGGGYGEISYENRDYIYVAIAEDAQIQIPTELTLTDSTDLAFFSPGDKVTELVPAPEPQEYSFSATLYEGTGTPQAITTGIDNTGKALVWMKSRSSSENNVLQDTLNGPGKILSSNLDNGAQSNTNGIATFNADGYTTDTNVWSSNPAGEEVVAWNFKAGTGFFDIQTYSGNSAVQVIPHDLNIAPGMILIKSTSSSYDWRVYHSSLGKDYYGGLNSSAAFSPESDSGYAVWNNTEPTSSVFTVGAAATVNANDATYVAYLFADNSAAGIKCGTFTGGAGVNETIEVDCGFKAGWVMWKADNLSDGLAANWNIFDLSRGMIEDGNQPNLMANENSAELKDFRFWSTDTGFAHNEGLGGSSTNCIYVAIAASVSPPVDSLAFSTKTYAGNDSSQTINSGIDNTGKSLVWTKCRSKAWDHVLINTLRGGNEWTESNTGSSASTDNNAITQFNSTGYDIAQMPRINESGETFVSWNFRAAPGFLDITTWVGNSVAGRTIPHKLGSVPGMMIIKKLDTPDNWAVYHKDLGEIYNLRLNDQGAKQTGSSWWNNTSPTSTEFTLGTNGEVNTSTGEYVGYIFADTPGKIKCGSYQGQNYNQTVTTGFDTGWVLIKAHDSAEQWYIANTGIAPDLLFANLNDGEWDQPWITLGSNGFSINTTNDGVNGSGKNYVYIAIASDATAGEFPLIPGSGTVANSDPTNRTLGLTDISGTWKVGGTVVGEPLNTVSDNVVGQEGNTLTVTDTTGNWVPGLFAQGAEITASAPSPESIVFTSMNNGTTPVTGLNATLDRRLWTLESSDSASGPWTVVGVYPDNNADESQDGATPWGNPALEPNTFYQVKVKYESGNANPVESLYNTFKTGDS